MSKYIGREEYLTIKEFSEATGYTPQGLYKMINNPLNQLHKKVVQIKGKKYLPISCVSVIAVETVETVEKNNLNTLNENLNSLNQKNSAPEETKEEKVVKDITEEVINLLREELKAKDKQIEDLNNRLSELTTALQNEQVITRTEQNLNYEKLILLKSAEQGKGIFKNIFKRKNKKNEE